MTISDHSSSNNVDKVFDKANICLNYCNKERPLIEYAGGGGFRRKWGLGRLKQMGTTKQKWKLSRFLGQLTFNNKSLLAHETRSQLNQLAWAHGDPSSWEKLSFAIEFGSSSSRPAWPSGASPHRRQPLRRWKRSRETHCRNRRRWVWPSLSRSGGPAIERFDPDAHSAMKTSTPVGRQGGQWQSGLTLSNDARLEATQRFAWELRIVMDEFFPTFQWGFEFLWCQKFFFPRSGKQTRDCVDWSGRWASGKCYEAVKCYQTRQTKRNNWRGSEVVERCSRKQEW